MPYFLQKDTFEFIFRVLSLLLISHAWQIKVLKQEVTIRVEPLILQLELACDWLVSLGCVP
jgi:hypothetical protein